MTFRNWFAVGLFPDKTVFINISLNISRRVVRSVKFYISITSSKASTFPLGMFFAFAKAPMSFRMQFYSLFDCLRPSSTRQFSLLKYLGNYSSTATGRITKMKPDLFEGKALIPMQTQQFIARDFVLYRYSVWHTLIILLSITFVKASLW